LVVEKAGLTGAGQFAPGVSTEKRLVRYQGINGPRFQCNKLIVLKYEAVLILRRGIKIGVTKSQNEAPFDGQVVTISEHENKLLEALRKLDYGELRVVVKGSAIVQIEEKKSVKL